MPKFSKKPVVIEANRFTEWGDENNPIFAFNPKGWLFDAIKKGEIEWDEAEKRLTINHPRDGQLTVPVGHWIIRGINGEMYPCAPDVFDASHDLVNMDVIFNSLTGRWNRVPHDGWQYATEADAIKGMDERAFRPTPKTISDADYMAGKKGVPKAPD